MTKASPSLQDVQTHWQELITTMRSRGMKLQALLRAGEPVAVDKNVVLIRFKHEFHTERVSEESNRRLLEEVLGQLLGYPIQVRCLMPDEPAPPVSPSDQWPPTISMDDLEREKSELQAQIEALHQYREEQQRQINELQARYRTEEEELKAQLALLQTRKQELETEVEDLQDQGNDLIRSLKDWESQVSQFQERVESLRTEAESLENEIQERKNQLANVKAAKTLYQQRLKEAQAEREKYTTDLAKLKSQVEQTAADLDRLQAQKYGPLWQTVIRADLDAGELTPYADMLLTRLEKSATGQVAALRLEIAARTGQTVLPPGCKESSGLPRLFANVIQARAAKQEDKLTEAVQMLCDGWDAVLPGATESPQIPLVSPVVSPSQTPMPEPKRFPIDVTVQWSAITLEVGGVKIVTDPGSNYPIPESSPDLAVVTHAHYDHVENLIPLCERFPDLPVLMTSETNDLLELSLDGWQVVRERQVQGLRFGIPKRVGDVEILLHPAGHLLGAAMADLKIGGTHILVTGDFSLRPVSGLPFVEPPQQVYDLVLMEAVHASDLNFPVPDTQRNRQDYLIDPLIRAIDERYSRVLIIAAALGDAQEVYHALQEAQKAAEASSLAHYTIFLKGLAYRVAHRYVQSGTWKTPVNEASPDIPSNSIVISRDTDAHQLRRQLEPTQYGIVFEPYKSAESSLSSERERRYQVDLHASLEELRYMGQHIRCGVIGLYHGNTKGSPLEKALRSAGKQVVNVTSVNKKRFGLEDTS